MKEKLKQVKLIATDLDGTLLRSSGEISSYTEEVIKKIREKGIYFTLVTGRMYHFFSDYVHQLQLDEYVISGDGALIKNRRGDILKSYLLPEAESWKVIEYLSGVSQNFFIIREDDVIKAASEAYRDLITFFGKNISSDPINRDDCRQLLKIVAIEAEDKAQKIAAELEAKFPSSEWKVLLGPSYMKKGYLVVIIRSPLINKAHAIELVADYYGIVNPQEEVLVFGDWLNDIPMFKKFPLSVAPKNCDVSVKKYVSYIDNYTNDEDCVARFLERNFL